MDGGRRAQRARAGRGCVPRHPLASGPGTFQAWLATAADDGRPAITRLWIGIHGRRGDLREAFPDPLGADRDAFADWIAREGAREHGVAVPAAPSGSGIA